MSQGIVAETAAERWRCHLADRQTVKETTALRFICPFLLNQAKAMLVCMDLTHKTNKPIETPEDGLLFRNTLVNIIQRAGSGRRG